MSNDRRGSWRVTRSGQAPGDRREFVAALLPHLSRHEAANNLQLSVLDQIAGGRYADVEVELLAAYPAAVGGPDSPAAADCAAVAIRTPPHNLLLSHGDDSDAREALLADLLDRGVDLPGVLGPVGAAEASARWWVERVGGSAEPVVRLGLYQLTRVIERPRASGTMRSTRSQDRELVIDWLARFNEDTHGALPEPEGVWESFHGGPVRRLYLWLDPEGSPASLAGMSGRTPNGRRIGPVYTPPRARRQGYAEALVAALSRQELAAGARFCFLYTDLDFPTSNRVYRSVGFEQIGEAVELRFTAA